MIIVIIVIVTMAIIVIITQVTHFRLIVIILAALNRAQREMSHTVWLACGRKNNKDNNAARVTCYH